MNIQRRRETAPISIHRYTWMWGSGQSLLRSNQCISHPSSLSVDRGTSNRSLDFHPQPSIRKHVSVASIHIVCASTAPENQMNFFDWRSMAKKSSRGSTQLPKLDQFLVERPRIQKTNGVPRTRHLEEGHSVANPRHWYANVSRNLVLSLGQDFSWSFRMNEEACQLVTMRGPRSRVSNSWSCKCFWVKMSAKLSFEIEWCSYHSQWRSFNQKAFLAVRERRVFLDKAGLSKRRRNIHRICPGRNGLTRIVQKSMWDRDEYESWLLIGCRHAPLATLPIRDRWGWRLDVGMLAKLLRCRWDADCDSISPSTIFHFGSPPSKHLFSSIEILPTQCQVQRL